MKTLLVSVLLLAFAALQGVSAPRPNVKGTVRADGKPLAGVLVSDGTIIVKTDAKGRYSFFSDKKDSTVFVIAPSGYAPVLKDNFRPDFWACLDKPLSALETHDFNLVAENQDSYTVMFLPDLHLVNDPRRQDIARFKSIVMPYIRSHVSDLSADGSPVYCMNLGDLTHEVYWYEMNFDEADAVALMDSLKFPARTYSITGNHDHDGAVTGKDTDFRSAWLYRRCWGPDRYSVNIGNEHWVMLDNLYYKNVAGKGKKAPGINGDRSYADSLTRAQLDWVAKDLAELPSDRNVIFCMHCPPYAGTGKNRMPLEQLEELDSLVARFRSPAKVYAGHVHCFDFYTDDRTPHLVQYALTCASGIMWETRPDKPLVASDGSDAGLLFAAFRAGECETHFYSYEGEENWLRVYDMNKVGDWYRNNPLVRKQQELSEGRRKDYSKPKYRNSIYVNYWGWMPGDTVEIFEAGKSLDVEMTRDEDPLNNMYYSLYVIESPRPHHTPRDTAHCIHMFTAKAATSGAPVLVRVKRDGKILHEKLLVR